MESHRNLQARRTEGENLEVLSRVSGGRQVGHDQEPEASIVAVIADEDASPRTPRAQVSKTRLDELRAHAASLVSRFDGYRAQRIPAMLGRAHQRGESHVTHHVASHHGDQG